MDFSVGVLYSSGSFLEFVKKEPISKASFTGWFGRFEVASSDSILAMAQVCEWVSLDHHGNLVITPRGASVIAEISPESRLQIQLDHLITARRPAWAPVLATGRREAEKAVPPEVLQCLREAGLLDGYAPSVVSWWERASDTGRQLKSEMKKDSGRRGELLSLEYERNRTGQEPYWQGFESNFAGYDVLSVMSGLDGQRLLIEVKTTYGRVSEGSFFLTRHEWQVGENANHPYVFHLWALKPKPTLMVVTRDQVEPHVPNNRGKGRWTGVEIQMSNFTDMIVPLG